MSRVLRWLLAGFAALTLLLALAWGWLFHSTSGRDFVLARAQAALGDERLRWGAIGGTIGGGLELDEVLLRLDTLQVEAQQIVVTIRPASLWRGRLRVESLAIAGLRLTPLRRTAQAAEPAWTAPSEWPPLPLPLRIEIAQLRVRELAWLGNSEAPLRAHELTAALMLSDRRMTLDALDFSTARGSARGEAELTLGTGSALDARLALTATVTDSAPWRAQVSVAGTPSALTLRIAGNAPGEFSLAGEWYPQRDQWRWQAQLRAQGIVPAALGGPPGRFGGELTVNGVDASATLSGFLQRDAQTLAIAPSTLSWQSPRLLLSPLQLGVAGGQARIAGEIDLGESGPRVALRVQAADLRWGGDAQPTRASGDARVEGWIDGWSVDAQAQLAHAGLTAQLRLLADGDAQRAQLQELSLVTPAGRSQLAGEVRFADALQWQLDGRLSGLDPGWFVADYPGALAARIRTHGNVRDSAIEAHASIDELSGNLRQRKVSGTARIDRRSGATTADIDLHVGASHVRVVGQLDAHVDARIRLAPLQLADLLPGAQGQLQGEVQLRGPRAQPLPSGDLQGHALVWGNFHARALRLRAQARGQGDTHAQLQASELAIDGFDIARLDVELDGRPEQARLTLSAASDALHAELTGSWAMQGTQRQFDLRSLRLAPAQGAPWQLRQPTRIAGNAAGAWQLPSLCVYGEGGEVCAAGNWPGTLTLHAQALDLSLAQPWLRRDDVQFALSGTLDVDASLRGGGASPLLGNAQVRGGAGSLQLLPTTRQPAFAWRALSVEAQLDAHRATAHLRVESDADGQLDGRIDMARAGDGALDGELNVDVTQLAWLELFSPDLAAPSGRLRGRFDLGGSRAAPRLSGQLSLQQFAAELPALGIALRDSSAHLSAAADGMLTLSALLNTGDGVLKVDGESALARISHTPPAADADTLAVARRAPSIRLNVPSSTSSPSLSPRGAPQRRLGALATERCEKCGLADTPLTLRLDGERVKVSETADVSAWISPALTVQHADGVLSVRGRVDVPQARIALDKRESRAAARSGDVEVLDPLEPESGDAALPLALDLDLQIGKDVRLSGFGLDGKLGGGLRVTQAPGREPLGTGTVTATGSYQRYGKPLDIRHARLTYTRSPLDDPALDIRAQRTVDAQMVGVQIDGTAQRPLTTLISDPALENGETLSWLVLGRPLRAAQQDDSARLDAAAMALGAGGNLLAEQVGARLGLDQAGVAESRALGANTLTVGKNLSPRLYLSYGVSLIGSGQVVALKYLLGGGFDLEIESGLESRGSINWRTEH